jgi:hypothetical protein
MQAHNLVNLEMEVGRVCETRCHAVTSLMQDSLRHITEQALALSPGERETLQEILLLSLTALTETEEADFIAEITDRREAFLRGELPARPFADILSERRKS